MENMVFFLGGRDAEMVRIAEVLAAGGCEVVDKSLGWGAHASAYAEEIAAAAAAGKKTILVELDNRPHGATDWAPAKVPVKLPPGVILVDHHNENASRPASILQILTLLGREPARLDELIAADDSRGPAGLVSFGATPEEFERVRSLGRKAQGITDEQEAEAARAVAAAEWFGRLAIVRCVHSKCAPITDRLFPSWEDGRENVLVLSDDGEVNYFGHISVRSVLQATFGGWSGGDPAGNGYWGGNPGERTDELVELVKKLAS